MVLAKLAQTGDIVNNHMTIQLWYFMQVFGPSMEIGLESIIENNEMLLL